MKPITAWAIFRLKGLGSTFSPFAVKLLRKLEFLSSFLALPFPKADGRYNEQH
jgi:hypothetical protein